MLDENNTGPCHSRVGYKKEAFIDVEPAIKFKCHVMDCDGSLLGRLARH